MLPVFSFFLVCFLLSFNFRISDICSRLTIDALAKKLSNNKSVGKTVAKQPCVLGATNVSVSLRRHCHLLASSNTQHGWLEGGGGRAHRGLEPRRAHTLQPTKTSPPTNRLSFKAPELSGILGSECSPNSKLQDGRPIVC